MTDTYKKRSRKSRAYNREHARYLANRETKLEQFRRNRQDYSSPRGDKRGEAMKIDRIAELANELTGQMPAAWYEQDRIHGAADRKRRELDEVVRVKGSKLSDLIRRTVQYHVNKIDPQANVQVGEHCNGYALDWSIRPPRKSPYVQISVYCGTGCHINQIFWPVSKADVQDTAIKLAQAVLFLKEIKSGRQSKEEKK